MLSIRLKRLGGLFLLLIALGIGRGVWAYLATGTTISAPAPPPSATAPLTPLLPARPSATPNPHTTPFSALLASPAAPLTPFGATPAADCRRVLPIESVETIHFGQTTTAQLQAAFGAPASVHGRPPTYRFVAEGCVLEVSVGFREAQEAILYDYGTLGWLLARYGQPAAVGISEGNLVLLLAGRAVLLYPERGVIAVFDALPTELTRTTPISALHFRAPYEVEKQVARLKLATVEAWQPPLR